MPEKAMYLTIKVALLWLKARRTPAAGVFKTEQAVKKAEVVTWISPMPTSTLTSKFRRRGGCNWFRKQIHSSNQFPRGGASAKSGRLTKKISSALIFSTCLNPLVVLNTRSSAKCVPQKNLQSKEKLNPRFTSVGLGKKQSKVMTER